MFAATIVPQPYLDLVKDQRYHLALAHLIDAPDFDHYTEFYKTIGWQHPDKYLILDNGLIEGDPRPIDELLHKAEKLQADELVLPDVFRNSLATVMASLDALRYVRKKNPRMRVMAVPQGSTYEEWLECARGMLTWDINTLAIPKVVSTFMGMHSRLHALQDLQPLLQQSGVQVHLLGCWDSPLELKTIESYIHQGIISPVRGVDSAIAYIYARSGMRMSDGPRPSGAVNFAAEDADLEVLKYNIDMWQQECASLPDEATQHPRIW